VLPRQDQALLDAEPADERLTACGSCGHVLHRAQVPNGQCLRCGQQQWQPAVLGT
jgi:hypothetical protein